MFYLEKGEIQLRKFDYCCEDVSLVRDWTNNQEVCHYMFMGHRPVDENNIREWYTNKDDVVFLIRFQGQNVGVAGLYHISWQPRTAEFRILIGEKSAQGQGVGTAVTKLVTQFAFDNLNLNKVWLGVNTENKAAVKCYEAAGFMHEGFLQQEVWRNGRYYDVYRMAKFASVKESDELFNCSFCHRPFSEHTGEGCQGLADLPNTKSTLSFDRCNTCGVKPELSEDGTQWLCTWPITGDDVCGKMGAERREK